jgi:hypothetical protein
MEKFRVLVWCESCRDDDEGCFGGESEVIGSDFSNRDDAERAGMEYCASLPYRYRVEETESE